MRKAYLISDNIYSPLGKTTRENMDAISAGRSGIRQHAGLVNTEPFFASLFEPRDIPEEESMTRFEQVAYLSAKEAMSKTSLDPSDPRTAFILSTTKGNVQLTENLSGDAFPEHRLSLNTSADIIAKKLGFATEALVVSHACISGLLAMITGLRLIQSGRYDNLVITGADLITAFIFSGFQSFQAISPSPCRPFDAARDGISLGEAAATVVLSYNKTTDGFLLSGGSVSNDANHISGPSRTGEELYLAVQRAMSQAGLTADDIDFISAHGTATRYNDEMEAKAIHLASMQDIPVNSFKGYYGHTLGAAGILESVLTMQSMKEERLIPTRGYQNPGTEKPVNVIGEGRKAHLQKCLKTASGFGGCNAAIIIERSQDN